MAGYNQGQHKWEMAWSYEQKRYFYYDRGSGKSYWLKPKDCPLQEPKNKPPPKAPPKKLAQPDDLPDGWKAVLDEKCDPTGPRWYYYNVVTNERTWYKPQMSEEDKQRRRDQGRNKLVGNGKPGAKPQSRIDELRHLIWCPDNFKNCLEEAVQAKEQSKEYYHKLLKDVYESNVSLIARSIASRGLTSYVSYEDCERALANNMVQDYGTEPQVSFSSRTVAEAMLHFASQDPRRVVCGMHVANGDGPARGYPNGDRGEEEDLCRRVPGLHEALTVADHQEKFPFGPAYKDQDDKQTRFCDVLYTENVKLMRGREEDGFPILLESEQVNISIVSAAPPRIEKGRDEDLDERMLTGAITSIFVAPVLRDARVTTLILSAWGCNDGCPPEQMAHLFAKTIVGEVKKEGARTRLGRLYHEIHFAIPPTTPPEGADEVEGTNAAEDPAFAFRRVFNDVQYGIRAVDMGV